MINDLKEVRIKAAEMFVNFSDLLKKDVTAFDGTYIGRVWDMSSKLGEVYPKVEDLIIVKGTFNRLYASVPWSNVDSAGEDIVLNISKDDVKFTADMKEYELLFRRDILDQQVLMAKFNSMILVF